MAGPAGFEPATYGSLLLITRLVIEGRRSVQTELRAHMTSRIIITSQKHYKVYFTHVARAKISEMI